MKKIIVFTDLDATLLDEKTYSAELSLPALRELQDRKIDVVFCSSKTREEQEVIRRALDVRDPFIVENGSAIIIPPDTIQVQETSIMELDGTRILQLGTPIEEIRATLQRVVSRTGISYQSFRDLSAEEVMRITNLDLESAKRATRREYSETIVTQLSDSELDVFIHECELNHLHCTFGGRFLSIIGKEADKGKAVHLLTQQYRFNFGEVITVGVGDSLNDAPMLREVDCPYLVQRPDGRFKNVHVDNLNYINAVGPLGFSQMVQDIKSRWPLP